MQLDLGGMLAALEKKQHSQSAKPSSRPVVFSGKCSFSSPRDGRASVGQAAPLGLCSWKRVCGVRGHGTGVGREILVG